MNFNIESHKTSKHLDSIISKGEKTGYPTVSECHLLGTKHPFFGYPISPANEETASSQKTLLAVTPSVIVSGG
jgi:hypothetical protein